MKVQARGLLRSSTLMALAGVERARGLLYSELSHYIALPLEAEWMVEASDGSSYFSRFYPYFLHSFLSLSYSSPYSVQCGPRSTDSFSSYASSPPRPTTWITYIYIRIYIHSVYMWNSVKGRNSNNAMRMAIRLNALFFSAVSIYRNKVTIYFSLTSGSPQHASLNTRELSVDEYTPFGSSYVEREYTGKNPLLIYPL